MAHVNNGSNEIFCHSPKGQMKTPKIEDNNGHSMFDLSYQGQQLPGRTSITPRNVPIKSYDILSQKSSKFRKTKDTKKKLGCSTNMSETSELFAHLDQKSTVNDGNSSSRITTSVLMQSDG